MSSPVKPITITDFSPGLQTQADPSTLAPGAAQVCQNVTLERTDLYVRDGRVIHCAIPVYATPLTAPVRAIGELFMAGHSPEHRFIGIILNAAGSHCDIYWNVTATSATAWTANTAFAQGKVIRAVTNTPTGATSYVYECTTAGTSHATTEPTWTITEGGTTADGTVTWTCRHTEMWQEINASYNVHATNLISMQEFGGKLYIADGSGWVLELTPDGTFTTLTDFPGPTTAPLIEPTSGDLTLDTCDEWTAKTTGYEVQGGENDAGVWDDLEHNNSSWHVFNTGGINNPHVDVEKMYALAQATTIYTGDGKSRSYSMALYVDAATDYDGRLDGGDVYLMRNLPPPPVSGKLPTREDAYDLSGATRINFPMKVEANEMIGADGNMEMWLVLGEDDQSATPANWQKVQITQDADGTALASLAVDTWYDFSIDITGLADAAINSVRWLGFFFNDFDMTPETDPVGTTNDYIRITFGPITANMSQAAFMQDTYEFTYTFWDDGLDEESSEYINPNSLAAPYPTLIINYNIPAFIQVKCTRPIGSVAESAYVYARGGVEKGDLVRIGTATFSGDTTAVRTAYMAVAWDGIYSPTAARLSENRYIGRPPKGVTMMTQYRNRMLYSGRLPRLTWTASTAVLLNTDVVPITLNGYYYVCTTAGTTAATEPSPWGTTPGGTTADGTVTWTCYTQDASDVLFYSNYGDPSRVKIIPFSLAQSPVTEGGWIDTERYGDNITGLIGAGMFLYALKRQAIFRGRGDPGITGDAPDSFFLEQLDTLNGSVSAASVCAFSNMVAWHSANKIMAIASGADEPVDITSGNLLPTVKAYSSTKQESAFAVYDQSEKRLYMFYPSGSYATSPNSECLMLSLLAMRITPVADGPPKVSGWTQFTAQPGACGLYSAHAPTPGVYLADAYGASGRGKLFRLSSTAVTDAISYGDAAAISWAWVSGVLRPFVGGYTRLARFSAETLTAADSGTYTLGMEVWPDNSSAKADTLAGTVEGLQASGNSENIGEVVWLLAPHLHCTGLAIKLARSSHNLVAVRRVELDLRNYGVSRGRGY